MNAGKPLAGIELMLNFFECLGFRVYVMLLEVLLYT